MPEVLVESDHDGSAEDQRPHQLNLKLCEPQYHEIAKAPGAQSDLETQSN